MPGPPRRDRRDRGRRAAEPGADGAVPGRMPRPDARPRPPRRADQPGHLPVPHSSASGARPDASGRDARSTVPAARSASPSRPRPCGSSRAPPGPFAAGSTVQVPRSTALRASLRGRRYPSGPPAQYSLNPAKPSPPARQAARAAGAGERCAHLFQSVVVRAIEVVHAIGEALRILEAYLPAAPRPPVDVRAAGPTEAPRASSTIATGSTTAA